MPRSSTSSRCISRSTRIKVRLTWSMAATGSGGTCPPSDGSGLGCGARSHPQNLASLGWINPSQAWRNTRIIVAKSIQYVILMKENVCVKSAYLVNVWLFKLMGEEERREERRRDDEGGISIQASNGRKVQVQVHWVPSSKSRVVSGDAPSPAAPSVLVLQTWKQQGRFPSQRFGICSAHSIYDRRQVNGLDWFYFVQY